MNESDDYKRGFNAGFDQGELNGKTLAGITIRQQAEEIEQLKKEKWLIEVEVQQQTLAHIIKLLTLQHDTLACTSYPMKKKETK